MPPAFPEKQARGSLPSKAAQVNEFCEILSVKVSKRAWDANSCSLHAGAPATLGNSSVKRDFAKPSVCDCKMFAPHTARSLRLEKPRAPSGGGKVHEERRFRKNAAESQNVGCRANLQDHIRNDVDVRSIAGSVVLNDCMLSRYTATDEALNIPSFPLNFLNVSAPFAGHRIIPPTIPEVAAEAGPSTAAPQSMGVPPEVPSSAPARLAT